jgi:Phosphotransferase enzyme family
VTVRAHTSAPSPAPDELPAARPSTDELATRLGALLGTRLEVKIRELLGTGTFPKEVVRVRTEPGASPASLFMKYENGFHREHLRDRGGVPYEARVYRDVLGPAGFARDVFLGAAEGADGRVWLVLAYLEDGVRIMKVPDGRAMVEAAGWVGRLHRAFEGRDDGTLDSPWLLRYDAVRLRSWATLAASAVRRARKRDSSVEGLIARFRADGVDLLVRSSTLIHGEYYPKNVLLAGGRIHPVDWESAAVGPGEIDLAMLTDGWPTALAGECTARYAAARWPEGVPSEFGSRLHWARVCTQLRWLAEQGFDADRLHELRTLARAEECD